MKLFNFRRLPNLSKSGIPKKPSFKINVNKGLNNIRLNNHHLNSKKVSSFNSSFSNLARKFSTAPKVGKAVSFEKFGNPKNVLKITETPLKAPTANQVLVKFIASPINPSDLNIISGTYADSKPGVAGNEGVAQVVQAGQNAKLKVGDRVIPAKSGLGTWRDYGVFEENEFHQVPSDISTDDACTMAVSSSSALRMLEDFEKLKSGDVIIQNGANSATGQALTSLAASKGVRIINVVRDGRSANDYENLHSRMQDNGAHLVVTDRYLKTPQFRRLISDLPAPKLALNSVGGDSATEMARVLAPGGTLVTYGGLSFKPVTIPSSLFIYKGIQLKGFWLNQWLKQNSEEQKLQMYNTVYDYIRGGHLKSWIESWDFSQFENALARSAEPYRDRKIVLGVREE